MHLPSLFLSSLLAAATTLALPSHNVTTTLVKRDASDDCFKNCMDNCHPPRGAGNLCDLPCAINCYTDHSHGWHYTETNLDDFVHNREGTLVCYNRVGS